MVQYLNKHFSGKGEVGKTVMWTREALWLVKTGTVAYIISPTWYCMKTNISTSIRSWVYSVRGVFWLWALSIKRHILPAKTGGKMAVYLRGCLNNSQANENSIWLPEMPPLFNIPNGTALSCWQSTGKSLMAVFQIPPPRHWPSTSSLWLASLIRTETGNFVRSKGSFGLRLTLIFIQFQSRTYPRNLLSRFQHHGEDNEGKSFLILS